MPTLATTFGTLQHSRARAGKAPRLRAVGPGDVPSEIAAALRAMALLAPGEQPRLVPLSHSQDARIFRAERSAGALCVKWTQSTAGTDADEAIADRVGAESHWLRLARSTAPDCAPDVLGVLPSGGWLALEYLDEAAYPTWHSRLANGQVEPWVAAELGHLTGRLHATTARDASVARDFTRPAAYQALRLAPAFGRIAAAHPDCTLQLQRIEAELSATRIAVVHGDLTPDNVLSGPRGPVLIDADCAHHGDPAVDVAAMLAAFCVRMAGHCRLRAEYAASWEAFHRSYAAHVVWEIADRIEARVAALVPALVLGAIEAGRVAGFDGASAVGRAARDTARGLLLAPSERLGALRDAWLDACAGQ